MKKHFIKSKILVVFVVALFSLMMFAEAMPLTAGADSRFIAQGKEESGNGASSQTAGKNQSAPAAQLENEGANSFPTVKEKVAAAPKEKKKKKFPWLLAVAGALLVGVAVYFIVVANKKYTLTTTVGTGVSGEPAAGSVKYKKGSVVNYSYSVASGYTDLVVTLDGTAVAASGTVKMDKNHTLSATAKQSFVLTVTKSNGVSGLPETGTYTYGSGAVVNYSYGQNSGYSNLAVKLDNVAVSASGTVTMNSDHALTASATSTKLYKLTVAAFSTGYRIISWNPAQGVYYFYEGTQINWSYTGNPTSGPLVDINGVTVCSNYTPGSTCSGSFILNVDTVITVGGH